MPLPAPVNGAAWEELQATAYPRVKAKPKKPRKPREYKLVDSHRVAWDAYQFAIKTNPALAHGTDQQVYEWLVCRPEFAGQLPPTVVTFWRYLSQARKHFHGQGGKRKLRRAAWEGNGEKGGAPDPKAERRQERPPATSGEGKFHGGTSLRGQAANHLPASQPVERRNEPCVGC